MISRVAGTASVLFTLLSGAIVWRLVESPDSDWMDGVVAAAPFAFLAVALAALATWTSRRSTRSR